MSNEFEEGARGYALAIYRQLEHEDGLMINRLSWLVASQSFLFTAYAIVLNGTPQVQNVGSTSRHNLLQNLLPILGLATCGLIYLGVLAGLWVTRTLRREFWQSRGAVGEAWKAILGTRTSHLLGLAAPLLLPPLFLAAWAALLWSDR